MELLLTTKEVLEKYDIPKKFFNKLEKDFHLTKIKRGRYNLYNSKEIDDILNQFSNEQLDEVRNGKLDPRNKLNDLTGKQWMPETKSFFYQKGLGSKHPHAQIEKQHPAPFSYQDIQRLIEMFTKSKQVVLDPFLGVGSTLKAAALTNRKGIGIELSEKWTNLSIKRLETEVAENESKNHIIINGDSRIELTKLEPNSIDFIVTSPPYWSILNKKADHKVKKVRLNNNLATNYSHDLKDLGNIENYNEFLDVLCDDIFLKAVQLLKPQKYMAVIVSDFRNQSEFISFHSDLIQRLNHLQIDNKFKLSIQGVKVLLQNHKSLLPYGYPFAYVENIHHQYILIFRKVKL
ncbi:DNA methyltransferase [Staphylococcus hominis]|uniref:DNA methyltransferase n=1 Tax=Staphylococcus hominis TaxID=1290 RepID=UPI00265C0C75|nr:DNA methyltransferase [Staphylococcus hominis]MDO0983525.1 DNA methyltransferase [Staphylococcus hominis]